jgi:hypothetical protein
LQNKHEGLVTLLACTGADAGLPLRRGRCPEIVTPTKDLCYGKASLHNSKEGEEQREKGRSLHKAISWTWPLAPNLGVFSDDELFCVKPAIASAIKKGAPQKAAAEKAAVAKAAADAAVTKKAAAEKSAAEKAAQYALASVPILSLAELKDASVWRAKGVDPAKREQSLSDADFEAAMSMDKESFAKAPKWKQVKMKKDLGIF